MFIFEVDNLIKKQHKDLKEKQKYMKFSGSIIAVLE